MWDRFDDAMRSIENEERELRDERERLGAALAARGVQVPPWDPPPGLAPEDWSVQAEYESESRHLMALRAYVERLRDLAAKPATEG